MQTTRCWSWQYDRLRTIAESQPQSRGTVGLGRLVEPIANPYPLKPCGTATLVNLSEGDFDLP